MKAPVPVDAFFLYVIRLINSIRLQQVQIFMADRQYMFIIIDAPIARFLNPKPIHFVIR